MTKPNTTKSTSYPFTADEIAAVRDGELVSWRAVAQRFNLGSPGAARRAYSALVRPHTASVLPGRTTGAGLQPVDLAAADLDTIREAIGGRTIVVQRAKGTEDITVAKVTSLKNGNVSFNDGNKARTVKAEAIVATK